MALQ
ncbi:unnamed protein product [Staurois parvus]|jgi:hypothetical protein